MFRLPVSGLEVALRPLTGLEERLLLETPDDDALVPALAEQVAHPVAGGPVDWGGLSVTDGDALILGLRRMVFGDLLRAESLCSAPGCGAKLEVGFHIGEFLVHHAPRPPRRVEPDGETGWFRFTDAPVLFRFPTLSDQIAIAGHRDPERALILRCVRPPELPARLRRRVETALESLAPHLSSDLQGVCPECGKPVEIAFNPRHFCLKELREQAGFLYEDIHLLASYYHWSEADILALPRMRRLRYAEMIRSFWRTT